MLFCLPAAVFSQDATWAIPRAAQPIVLDGHVAESEWGSIDTLALVSHWPTYSPQANTRTRLRIAYDNSYIYFSAVCFDDPTKIQGPFFERDKWELTEDQVMLFLDTYNDNENGVAFVVTPTGSRIDVSIKNDAQGGSPHDLSWNSYWEARTVSLDNGWSMEGRIPFSSLRFQANKESVTMGLIAYRYIAREKQMDIFPSIPSNWGFWSFVKASKAVDVVFTGIQNKRPWFTSPYVAANTGHHYEPVEPSGAPSKIDDRAITAGLDIQHALTDNINMDVTINTDFAQVEADDQIVNLSRFSYYFPEKRRFFLERSSIMEFGFENSNRLFYSRRIGIDSGRVVPLWGGARWVARVGNYDVGLLSMQSREQPYADGENFGVLRLRRKISKSNSYVGGIVTSRIGSDGRTNITYGVDGILNIHKNDYLRVNVAQSDVDPGGNESARNLPDRKRIYVLWENRSQVGFNYSLSYSQVDKNYQPGIGFETRDNFRSFGDRLSYGWFPTNKSSLRYAKVDLNAAAYFSQDRNQLESYLLAPSFSLEWVKNSRVQVTLSRFFDRPTTAFYLSNVEIAPGSYRNQDVTLFYQTPSVTFLNSEFTVTAGKFYEGDRLSVGITPMYIVSRYLTLSGFYQYNRILFSDNRLYEAHVARLKVATAFNVKLSINAFAQLNSIGSVSALNLRLRYNWKDGNDLYLVYNETLNNEARIDPALPASDYRSVILKYIYTFHIGR